MDNSDNNNMIFYHGTSEDNWKTIQKDGQLFGRRYIVNSSGSIVKELQRCTYLAVEKEEAMYYGDVVLEVRYNPYNKNGSIKKDKSNRQLNNYVPGCWQVRVYEPISLDNIKRIKTFDDALTESTATQHDLTGRHATE